MHVLWLSLSFIALHQATAIANRHRHYRGDYYYDNADDDPIQFVFNFNGGNKANIQFPPIAQQKQLGALVHKKVMEEKPATGAKGKISKEEAACGKIVDANKNDRIDESEKKAFISCLKGATSGYDADGDKVVSPRELRCGVAADKNANGKIDPGEIEAFEKCLGIKPAKGIQKDTQQKAKAKAASKIETMCRKIADQNNDGKLDEEEKKGFVKCLKKAKKRPWYPERKLQCLHWKPDHPDAWKNCFYAEYDLDGDGKVSEEEVECGWRVDRYRGKNGKISEAKMGAFRACVKGSKGGYDLNGDGKVSSKEFRCGSKADVNHDGNLDPEERKVAGECFVPHADFRENKSDTFPPKSMRKLWNQFAKLFDLDNDGYLNVEETKRATVAYNLAKKMELKP
eukprot:243422_1